MTVPGAIPAVAANAGSGPAFSTTLVKRQTSAEMKSAAYGALAALIEGERLLIPESATDLRRELGLLRIELTATGVERIEGRGVAADDLADALMLATVPYRAADGRWRARLWEWAKRERWRGAPAEFEGLDALPTVTSGGGVVVPKSPAWASVAGPEVSPPAGVRRLDAAEIFWRRVGAAGACPTTTRGGRR